nr:KH domain-containing protein [Anaerolineae bacterium]
MKDLVEFIAKTIVDDPSLVQVNEIEGATSIILELSVGPDEMGRIIGRGGRVANAIRVLLRSLAAKEGKRVTLEIIESGER